MKMLHIHCINNCVALLFFNLPPHGTYAPGERMGFFSSSQEIFADKLKTMSDFFPPKQLSTYNNISVIAHDEYLVTSGPVLYTLQ